MLAHRLIAAAALGAATLGLAACAPTYEGVTPAEFAATTCGLWDETAKQDAALEEVPFEPLFDSEPGDRTDQLDRVIEVSEAYLAHVESARAASAEAVPAVKDGEAIAQLFVDYYEERLAIAEPLVEEFRSTETEIFANEISFAAGDMFFFFQSGLDFPFSDVEDQDLIEAIGAEPTCADYVEVSQYGF